MGHRIRAVVAGASGKTGGSITAALLKAPDAFDVTILVRQQSVGKPVIQNFKEQGAKVIVADLSVVTSDLVSHLIGADVVISCFTLLSQDAMVVLADASIKARVGRFVPSFWGPSCPPRGVMYLRDTKEDLLDQLKKAYLPYTVIDVGWWYQVSIPAPPSGKLDGKIFNPPSSVVGDGNVESALIDNRDIGKYVARIIVDPRTLNRSVLVYNELWTQNKIFDLMERVSGEVLQRNNTTQKELETTIADGQGRLDDMSVLWKVALAGYNLSVWARGDNVPEKAKYLGYLIGKELYPELQGRSLEVYIRELFDEAE